MTSPYVIREVDGDEHELELRELHDETFGDTAPNVDAGDGYWWLAFERATKAPVAFAGLCPSKRYLDTGYLYRAGVSLGHRGHGLQRKLIRVRELKARKLGWACLVSDTSDSTTSANNLIKAGYTIYNPEFKYAFRHTIYWRKFLANRPKSRGRSTADARGTSGSHPEAAGPCEVGDVVQDQRAEDAGGSAGAAGDCPQVRGGNSVEHRVRCCLTCFYYDATCTCEACPEDVRGEA